MSNGEQRRESSQVLVEPFTQRRQVEAMAGYGIPEAAIARVLEIDRAELRRLYARELDNGQVKANAKVGGEPVSARRPAKAARRSPQRSSG